MVYCLCRDRRITTAGAITEYPLLSHLGSAVGITAGPDGALWFTEGVSNKIGRITTAGVITEYPVANTDSLHGITTGPDGALWFTELLAYGNKIGRITTAGVVTEYLIPNAYCYPINITAGSDGALWFTEYGTGDYSVNKIGRITTLGIISEYLIPNRTSHPFGITAGPDGALWFTEEDGKIGRITTAGIITEYPTPTGYSAPNSITTGSDGALWFTETDKIGRITTTGVITEYPAPSTLPNTANLPLGITAGPDGALWFAEESSKIGRLSLRIGLGFVPIAPCRAVDTRAGQGTSGAFGPPTMGAGSVRDFPLASSRCTQIPINAAAYSVNMTVVPQGPLGYLTVWPTGPTQPFVSTLNAGTGLVVANAAIVPAGANGGISVFVTNPTDVIIDMNGYFIDPAAYPASMLFYGLGPCRVFDTRNSVGVFGAPRMAGGSARDFPVPASGCGAPTSAQAYSMNYTVVPQGPLGYLTTWAAGQIQPFVSTLNSNSGAVLANAAIVPAGSNGSVSVFVSDSTDVVGDINGYFGPAGGANPLKFFPIPPCRAVDTRAEQGPTMLGGQVRSFAINGCSIPSTVEAYAMNVTVVPQGPLGYLTTWPVGQGQPFVSTLNSPNGAILANAAIVPAGTNGALNVYVTNSTNVIIDVNGYFAP